VTSHRPTRPRIEHSPLGLGIGCARPRLSWWLPEGSHHQAGYRVEATIDGGGALVAEVASSESVLRPWPFDALDSRARVTWRVQVLVDGEWSECSERCDFEVGLLHRSDWEGQFVGLPGDGRSFGARGDRGAIHLRRRFTVEGAPVRARLRATALGIYELHLDGRRVGDLELTPGFTAYRSTLEAQTYDVTELLTPGEHEVVATLTDGWYRGSVGFTREEFSFGDRLALLAQLELHDADGGLTVVATDEGWEVTDHSPIVAADLMEGERVDLRRPFPPVDGWVPVEPVPVAERVAIVVSPAPPTRAVASFAPDSVVRLDADRQVVSLPVNINGWLRIASGGLGPVGTEIRLSHGEVLGDDGDVDMEQLDVLDFMTQQPLGPNQIDTVVSGGPGGPGFEPRHTTHGFQHVRVEGAPDLSVDGVEGVLVHTDMRRTGWFRCSHPGLERLHEAAVLSFVDNACEIPTDCPQRERAGWTGDWQLFAPTAAFLYDVAGFTDRWLRDLAADQWPDGRVTNHVPDPVGPAGMANEVAAFLTGASGWGDAATLVPWAMWEAYGDEGLLERQYPSMVAWVRFALGVAESRRHPTREAARPTPAAHENRIWDAGFHWGEWCEPDADGMAVFSGQEDQGHVATAYLARSLDVLARTARLLERDDEAATWSAEANAVRAAWRAEFVDDEGRVTPRTQANLCRALAFDLVDPADRAAVFDDLVTLVEDADFHVGTGFLTTPFLLPTLADEGREDVAFRLLLQETSPSWLAMIDAGATTIWENWEGVANDIHASLNHYSKGAVVSFLHRYVAGIRMVDGEAAYRRFEVRPVRGGGLTWAEAELDSPYGRIRSAWRLDTGRFDLAVDVPPGTAATVVLPDGTATEVGPGHHELSCEGATTS
jgi:alpha-L-rhamnosidase